MARSGYKMPPARCSGCGAEGPAKCVALKRGWKNRGPQQRRRWYCPSCEPPAEPVPVPCAEPVLAPRAADPPTEPFARLRWDTANEHRLDMERRAQQPAQPAFSIVAAICGLSTGEPGR